MSINPGQRTSSIYQQDKDAFSSQLDLSAARHGSAHAKANSQVNRLSRVFDGSKGQRPPPPPSKPQALRSSTAIHRVSRSDEIATAADHSSHSPNEHFSDRPMSAASSASESVTETAAADAMPESPTLSFKDLQAKFQRAASNTTDVKSPAGRPKWQINTGSMQSLSGSASSIIESKPKYPNSPVASNTSTGQFKLPHTMKHDSDQLQHNNEPSISRLVKTPAISAKPYIAVTNHSHRDIASEISKKLESGAALALIEKRETDNEHHHHLPSSSPKMLSVYKNLPTLPNPLPPIHRSQPHTRPDPVTIMPSPDTGMGKPSQRKAWMVTSMKSGHGAMSPPVPSSLASTPSLEIPIARSTTGNSVSSTTSSSSTSSQANGGGQFKRGRGYSGFGSLFGGASGSSAEDHHQSIKNSITIVSKEPIQQRDSMSSSGSTRPPSSAEMTPYTSQPVSPLLDGRDAAAKRSMKRYNVMKELVETERTYRNDMILLKEVYFDGSLCDSSPLDKADVKLLFSNLPNIVDFESEFLALLEASCNLESDAINDNESDVNLTDPSKGEDQSSCIGMTYITMMPQIEQIYCDYCKRHETAVIRLQELECKPEVQAFFKACQQKIQDRTTSWDLGSMLIKPVQRVLKYPLLLQQIRTMTQPTHPDFENLERATREIQEVADRINEIKRRKDIVEKIVGDRRRTDVSMVHGINKTFTRRAQKFKQATGIAAEGTQDALFDALFAKFEEQQESARQLARDTQGWLRHVKENFEALYQLAVTLEDVYTSWGGVTVKSLERIKDFKECAVSFITSLSRELETLVRSIVYTRIDSFLKLFNNPSQVIIKRSNKLIDHDRANGIKQKGGIPDKALQESADAYVSINAQLVDELPRFLSLTTQYFEFIVEEFAVVQSKFYKLMAGEWKRYMFKGSHAIVTDNIDSMTLESITTAYMVALRELDPSIEDIVAINPHQWESIAGFQSTGPDSNATTPSLTPLDQYFGSPFGGLRNPSLHSLPLSEGTASSYKRTPTRTGSNFSQDTYPNTMAVASRDDTWSDSSSFRGAGGGGDRPLFERVIMFDCDSQNPDQLAVRQGDVVTVWQADDDEWWYASSTHTVTGEENWGWVLAAACK